MDLQEFIEQTEIAELRESLPWWVPTAKHPAVVARVLEYQSVETAFGLLEGAAVELLASATVVEKGDERARLAEAGDVVSIWFKNTVLRNAWSEPRPVGGPPAVGEVVGIKHVGSRQGRNGPYPLFVVQVHGREGQAPTRGTPMTQADALDPTLADPSYEAPRLVRNDEPEEYDDLPPLPF